MSEASPVDDRGRLTIKREFRSYLGERVVQILTPRGLLLRPLKDDPEALAKLPPALEANGDAAYEEDGA